MADDDEPSKPDRRIVVRKTALLIEGPEGFEIMQRLLERQGFEVIRVNSIRQAWLADDLNRKIDLVVVSDLSEHIPDCREWVRDRVRQGELEPHVNKDVAVVALLTWRDLDDKVRKDYQVDETILTPPESTASEGQTRMIDDFNEAVRNALTTRGVPMIDGSGPQGGRTPG